VSKQKRELSADERRLWRRVAESVKSRRPSAREAGSIEKPGKQTPPAGPAKSASPPATPRSNASPSPPQNRANEKRVRRGKLDVDAMLDLHGHTQDGARAALGRFLHAAQRRGDRTVVVITGLGRSGEGVLKRRLPEWLGETDLAALVSGYAPTHRAHGGGGAFYVFVKRRN
jgi:DNA-nicking Smr family endonuclease